MSARGLAVMSRRVVSFAFEARRVLLLLLLVYLVESTMVLGFLMASMTRKVMLFAFQIAASEKKVQMLLVLLTVTNLQRMAFWIFLLALMTVEKKMLSEYLMLLLLKVQETTSAKLVVLPYSSRENPAS